MKDVITMNQDVRSYIQFFLFNRFRWFITFQQQ